MDIEMTRQVEDGRWLTVISRRIGGELYDWADLSDDRPDEAILAKFRKNAKIAFNRVIERERGLDG